MISRFLTSESEKLNFVDLDVPGWAWAALLAFICVLLAVDILVIHRKAHDVGPREALIESAVWISIGLASTAYIFQGSIRRSDIRRRSRSDSCVGYF